MLGFGHYTTTLLSNNLYYIYMDQNALLIFAETIGFQIYDWVLLFGIAFLAIEIIHDIIDKRMDKRSWRETFNSIFTQVPLYFVETLVYGAIVAGFFVLYHYAIQWKLPVSWWMFILTLIATDLVYYIEHRLAHRVRLLWVAHSVHHSAQNMNTATAFRFSVIDPLISSALHLPLILLGFHPAFVLAGELLVQAYQFWIHNTIIPKLGVIEYILNTPSSHRVHHAREIERRDSNYAGIFIIWDRLFGTYQKEPEKLEYGLPEQIETMNPVTVQFHEVPRLMADLKKARGMKQKLHVLFGPPAWLERREKVFDDKYYAQK